MKERRLHPVGEAPPELSVDRAGLGQWGEADDAHSLGVLSVLPGSRVLDVGCGSGEVGRYLGDRHCRVWGIEIRPEAAGKAEQHLERVIAGDVESLDLAELLGDTTFDAILALDVLEHLKDPGAAVRKLIPLLAPGGRFIASIPNVTHAAVRLQLLGGRFVTTEEGLLDRTHLHFFDRPAAEGLLEQAGLVLVDRMRVRRGLTETEIPADPGRYTDEVIEAIMADPDAETYQFVLVGSAGPEGGSVQMPPMAAALQARLEETHDALRDAGAYAAHLEAELTARMADLEVLHGELRHLQADLEIKDAYVLELRSAVTAAEERAGLVDSLSTELRRVHLQVKVEADARADVEAEMAIIKSRAGYRVITRFEKAVHDRPVVRRLGTAAARLLAR